MPYSLPLSMQWTIRLYMIWCDTLDIFIRSRKGHFISLKNFLFNKQLTREACDTPCLAEIRNKPKFERYDEIHEKTVYPLGNSRMAGDNPADFLYLNFV